VVKPINKRRGAGKRGGRENRAPAIGQVFLRMNVAEKVGAHVMIAIRTGGVLGKLDDNGNNSGDPSG